MKRVAIVVVALVVVVIGVLTLLSSRQKVLA